MAYKTLGFCSNGRCYERRRINGDRSLIWSIWRKFCLPSDICQVLCVLFGNFLFYFSFIVEVFSEEEVIYTEGVVTWQKLVLRHYSSFQRSPKILLLFLENLDAQPYMGLLWYQQLVFMCWLDMNMIVWSSNSFSIM